MAQDVFPQPQGVAKKPSAQDLVDWSDVYALDDQQNPRRWGAVVLVGFLLLFVFFGVFGIWAALAPLGSGAIANGKLQVDTNQKTVQHLEGGIIERINVRDGDRVREGDVLVELDDTKQRLEFELLEQQYLTNLAVETRLLAERRQLKEIEFPRELTDRFSNQEVADVIENQTRLFENRLSALESQKALLQRRVAKSREEIAALVAQQRADRIQLDLISEEIEGVRDLFEKGLERKPRLLSLQRTAAQLEGSIGNREALIARAEQTIAETEFQLIGLIEQNASEIEGQLRQVRDVLVDVVDRRKAARDALDRTQIRAPQSGRVYGLRFHTEGGVIGPGEPILGIVPIGDDLIVQVRLDPTDIDVVHVGALAGVRLTSFNQRTTKPVDGQVVYISADVVQEDGAPPYYELRIELDRESLAKLSDVELLQGMPAMAVISTGDQTLLEYLVGPILRSLDTAMREN
jgi:HlyD family type I secretion membrane fusion protein